jgi:intracellular septation protein A
MTRIFGRELAVWLATIASVFQVVLAYGFDQDGHVQGIATAAVVFVFGVYTAWQAHDGIVALATSVFSAGVVLFAAFGLDMSATSQATWINGITAALSFFLVRPNVTAPVGPEVSPSGKIVTTPA